MKKKEEPMASDQSPRKASRLSDRVLVATGLALATASALFPWYVFFNQDKFGMNAGDLGRTRDLPPMAPRDVFSVSPLAMVDNTPDEPLPAPREPLDMLTTATVSSIGEERQTGPLREEQPFPGKGSFRLLHVANGRALIEDGSGMYMVRVGSTLPDESKLAKLEQREGRWAIITSAGEMVQEPESP